MGDTENSLWQTTHVPTCHPGQTRQYDLPSGGVPKLVRIRYLPDEQGLLDILATLGPD